MAHRRAFRIAVALGATATLLLSSTAAAPSAQARSLTSRIIVDTTDLSALGYVGDTLFNGRYTAVLTAVGVVACGLVGPQTAMAGRGTDTGNPATPSTPGTCGNPYNGVVTYELDWVAVPGTSGHLTRVCTVTAGVVLCSPEGATVDVPVVGER